MADKRDGGQDVQHLITAVHVSKRFESRGLTRLGRGTDVMAVRDVSLDLRAGETLAIVGESGSGKTTLGRMMVGLEPPTEGDVYLRGVKLTAAGPREVRALRRSAQMVFQDPYSSLHPRRRVRRIISEPWHIHPDIEEASARPARLDELVRMVGLSPAALSKYSGQLSGGERQRVALARALAMRPDIVVLDEPTSALDVSIQAQVIRLLAELQEQLHLSYLLISHDLPLVRLIADRVAVMHKGELMELGETAQVYNDPQSPYTARLLDHV